MKIRLVGAEFFHADGRTDGRTRHDEANRLPYAPKKSEVLEIEVKGSKVTEGEKTGHGHN